MTARPTIALVRDLCAALEADGVGYCHWKSNAFLDRSRTGENDLDLLIARADEDRFSVTMHRLGFKLALRPARALPGVLDYYGYDAESGRLVHVHTHYQLIVGDDLTKSYRIPLEDAFLGATIADGEFRVPPPELELILLVIRLVLKHLTWDAAVARRGKVPASARAELTFLQDRVDGERLNGLLAQLLPFVDARTFSQCLEALAPGARATEGFRAGRRLVSALEPCARRSRRADVALKFWRRGIGIGRRLLSRPAPRKRLAAGGAVIGIVGADGAGKSTAVDALHDWLGKTFAVTRVHLGKPPATRATIVLTTLARARSVPRRLSRSATARPPRPRSTQRALLATALARDRYLAARRAGRVATNGGLVICDRFPLPQLTLMDAPRLERVADRHRWTRLSGRLAAIEQRYYRAIVPPNILIVLLVDPEVAVARKPEEPADFVRARWREILDIDWAAVPAHVVDAGRPRDEVISRLRSLVWSEV